MDAILWIITGLAVVIAAAVMLLVVHGARQAEIHQQIRNDHDAESGDSEVTS